MNPCSQRVGDSITLAANVNIGITTLQPKNDSWHGAQLCDFNQSLYSLSSKTSYHQISWSLEAARLGVIMIVSLWNLTGISAALLPRCLINFRAIGKVQTRTSRLRDFTRSCGKTSYRLRPRGPKSRWCRQRGKVPEESPSQFYMMCLGWSVLRIMTET